MTAKAAQADAGRLLAHTPSLRASVSERGNPLLQHQGDSSPHSAAAMDCRAALGGSQ